jgi:hypothetical protein
MTRTPYIPPRLPASLARRDLRRAPAFEAAETLGVEFEAPAYPQKPRIVSSAHGPIRHVLLWYASYTPQEYGFQEIYGDLLTQLPQTTEVTIVAHPDVVDDLENLVAASGRVATTNVITSPAWLAFTVWAEDAFAVIDDVGVDPPVTYLLEPETFTRGGDAVLADLVAQPTLFQSTQVPLMFQGGNVLIGDRFVFIGRDYLDESIDFLSRTRAVEGFPDAADDQERFVRDLFRTTFDPDREFHFPESQPDHRLENRLIKVNGETWLEDVAAGRGARQPIFHIDMLLSLTGRNASGAYRILVGSPRLADELLGWEPVEHDLQNEFDAIAAQLEALGFDVVRTPLPYLPADEQGSYRVRLSDGRIVVVRGIRTWYYATSNNCLVQIDGDGRDVWLPTYGHESHEELAHVDAEHKRIWESLGFTVHQLGNFHPFALRLGALHCIKKYLAR